MSLQLPATYPVTSHTKYVGPGSTFVAIAGKKENGLQYIYQAVQQGASKVVVQSDAVLTDDLQQYLIDNHVELDRVKNCRQLLAQLSAQAWNFPAKKLKLIGVTGTKGKTSTSYMIYNFLKQQGYSVALISTAEKLINDSLVTLPLTTPLPDHLHAFFDMCVNRDVEYVVMEVSAQAVSLSRIEGLVFQAGVFTNFSLEHLEFYQSLDEYFQEKCKFFDYVKSPENMIVNIDDQYGKEIIENNSGYSSYSIKNNNAVWFARHDQQKMNVQLNVLHQGKMHEVVSPLIGAFNASNLLAAMVVSLRMGCSMDAIKKGAQLINQIPGRMEKYRLKNGSLCFIDYAHNPSSFEAVLSTLSSMTDSLIVVFGAGGCRDKSKRPLMGLIAEKYCDIAIITSDNPRDEDPAAIAQDIQAGFTGKPGIKVLQELNRTVAIEYAYELSKKGTIIAVLGKGRDEYQIVGDLTFPFKERSIIRPFMEKNDLYKPL